MTEQLWAITSYYNPVHYERRLSNYKHFRQNLNVPLVTVELSFDGTFELSEDDADVMIRVSGGAVLWQKERLLNLALKSVPADVKNIAWIDCDVHFDRADWMIEACELLKHDHIIQLFSDMIYLEPDQVGIPENCDYTDSIPSGVVAFAKNTGLPVTYEKKSEKKKENLIKYGLAWAARRELLDQFGFYDAMIIGGADFVAVCAIYGEYTYFSSHSAFDDVRRQHYLEWARPYSQAIAGRVGYVEGRLYHLWHGELTNRKYSTRQQMLAEISFDPKIDIRIGENGAWEWARPRPDLAAFLKNYFIERKEDGESAEVSAS
jgi:hypothetical protein